MSNYTQEEIEEMRKRLPFKAVVWDDSDYKDEEIIKLIFDGGKCANNLGVFDYFEEIKDPEYVPFTAETIKPFRDEWVSYAGKDHKINIIGKVGCRIGDVADSYKYLLENGATFADSGKPFGKEVKS